MNALKAPERSGGARTGPAVLVPPGRRLFRRLAEDTAVVGLGAAPAAGDAVQKEDLAGLPEPAQRYLRQAGVLGRPPDWSFALHSRGRFRLRRGWPAMPADHRSFDVTLADGGHEVTGDIRYNVAPAHLRGGHGPESKPGGGAHALQPIGHAGWNLRNWGATATEQQMTLPGDEFVPGPANVLTRAVTINAPADDAWRWLIQIGQDRGGIYSYDLGHCRLLSRSRAARQHGAARVAGYLMDPVTLLMTRKMLLGVKARAEASARSADHLGTPA